MDEKNETKMLNLENEKVKERRELNTEIYNYFFLLLTKIKSSMKQVTSFLLLMLFLLSTAVYAQKAGSGLSKAELEKAKLARMLVTSEQAPGTHAGPVQFTDDDYDLQFEYPCGDASGEAGAQSYGHYI